MTPAYRSLSAVALIASHTLRRTIKDGALFWSLLLPVAIVYILGVSLQGLFASGFTPDQPYRVAVVEPGGQLEEAVVTALRSRPEHFEITTYPDDVSARDAVAAREADAAVLAGAGDPPRFVVVAVPGAIVAKMLDGLLRAAPLPGAPGADSRGEPPAAEAAGEPEPSPATAGAEAPWRGIGSFDYFAVAIATMFAMFTVHSVTVYFAVDRASGAYARIRAVGVSRRAYRVAGFVSAVGVGVLFLAVMTGATRLLFGVRWGEPPAWLALALVGSTSLAALSFALMALVPKDAKRLEEFGSAVFIVLSFLGGSTVPLNVVPAWFARAFAWLPNRALLDGYLRLSSGGSLEAIRGPMTTLAVAACCLFLLGWLALGFQTKEEM